MGQRKKDEYVHESINKNAEKAFKRYCQKAGVKTGAVLARYGFSALPSYGSTQVVRTKGIEYTSETIETLGSKIYIADEMHRVFGMGHEWYRNIGWDAVATIVNDSITRGTQPYLISMQLSVDSGRWFEDTHRSQNIVDGWVEACMFSGCFYGQGETSTIIQFEPGIPSCFLGGSATGFAKNADSLITGNIEVDDQIILFPSAGLQTNGYTTARRIALAAPNKFETRMSDGRMYGEALLDRSIIYTEVIMNAVMRGVKIHHAVHITGNAWLKFMDTPEPFVHNFDVIPEPSTVFKFIQEHGKFSDRRMYATFNMGAGFAVYVPSSDVNLMMQIGRDMGAFVGGYVKRPENGKGLVSINPKKLDFVPSVKNYL
ncbi:MAG: AIR synthase related protein [bacterium]|nr:AIR synthase related protein [bacterium]